MTVFRFACLCYLLAVLVYLGGAAFRVMETEALYIQSLYLPAVALLLTALVKRHWPAAGLATAAMVLFLLAPALAAATIRVDELMAQNPLFRSMPVLIQTGRLILVTIPLLLVLYGTFKWLQRFDGLLTVWRQDKHRTRRASAVRFPAQRICKQAQTGLDVHVEGEDRFLHTLIVGPTGGGKTALTFEPMIHQDIEFIAQGGKARVIVLEPDGEFTARLADHCASLNVPHLRVDATRPAGLCWNPLEGDLAAVAEMVTTVLQNSFGRQDAFFATVLASAARNTTLLLKLLHGDDVTLADMANTLRDLGVMQDKLNRLRGKIKHELRGEDAFVAENVYRSLASELSSEDRKEKYAKVCMGLRQQLDNLLGNPFVRAILCGPSNLRLEEALATEGVLMFNTGNNAAGDMFGKFLMLAMQDATMRRPGDANNRSPVFTYIDEFARYATDAYQAAFTQGRKYRNAQIIALQNFNQLALSSNPHYKTVVKGNCRNKIILSGLEYEDAKEAEQMMGLTESVQESLSYEEGLLFRQNQRLNERTVEQARYSADHLMLMPWNQIVYKIVQNKQAMPPQAGIVQYVNPSKRPPSHRTGNGRFFQLINKRLKQAFKGGE